MRLNEPCATPGFDAGLETVRQRLEDWRRTRKGGEPIPEELWAAAVELAQQQGLNPTARALGLNYAALKRRVEAVTAAEGVGLKPTFVELLASPSAPVTECTVELEHEGGARMRIHLHGVGTVDLAGLTRAFWRGPA